MKKIMFIGRTGCGKTSLTQALHGQKMSYLKTQAVKYCGTVVDTPGEFVENRRFYSALQVSASKADIIGLVHDATCTNSVFPPKFGAMFRKKIIGIISKSDLEQGDAERSAKFLKMAGAAHILKTSAVDKTGIQDLVDLLAD